MSVDDEASPTALDRSLARAHRALGPSASPPMEVLRQPEVGRILQHVGTGLGLGGVAFAGLAAVTTGWLLIPAAALGLGSATVLTVRAFLGGKRPSRDTPHIGLGSDVDESARIEPGGSVEMGASVGARTVIESGATVRMGASVGHDVVIESGAVVGWGASVKDGAIIRKGATIGAGADVAKGAEVAAGTHVGAGSSVRASHAPRSLPVPTKAPSQDPREVRIVEICTRLDAELKQASPNVRAFLGTPEQTVAALRETCLDILRRELQLRSEASSESLERLEQERTALASRVTAAEDESVRRSLEGALLAIDDQRRQRTLLKRNADRLDAELTRLLWTLEGLLSQVVRLRSEGTTGTDAELERTVTSLRDELDAVADAVESVGRDEQAALRRTTRA